MAVKTLNTGNLTRKFVIRSGGHTAQNGSANIGRRVTIDMSAFKDIVVSADRTLVTIGSGERWANVYAALGPLGFAVPGGRAAEVGVGGLLLGGDLSYFATRRGFSCDNVVSYEVVLASSSIVKATSNLHRGLWSALKGGSNNFGIVTRFVMRTFQQGAIFAADLYYPTSTAKQQFELFRRFISDSNYDEDAGLMHSWGFSDTEGAVIVNTIAYAKPIVNPIAFQPCIAIRPQLGNTTSVTSLTVYSKVLGAESPSSLPQAFAKTDRELTFSTSFLNDITTIQSASDLWNTSTVDIASVPGVKWTMTRQPINRAITSKSYPIDGNSLGLPLDIPSGALVLLTLCATWNDSSDNARVEASAHKLPNSIISTSKAEGTFNRYIGLNRADSTSGPYCWVRPSCLGAFERSEQGV